MPEYSETELPTLYRAPLLATESRVDYEAMRRRFFEEVKPNGLIEELYANEFLGLTWELARLNACKAAIIDSLRPVALRNLLILGKGEMYGSHPEERDLASRFDTDPAAREEIIHRLNERRLDESAIEAEAIRVRLNELQILEKLIASVELRRDKAILKISDYREYFATRLCKTTGSLIALADRQNSEAEGVIEERAVSAAE